MDTEGSNKKAILLISLSTILNGGTFFIYILCAMGFAAIWKRCGDGEQSLGSESSDDVEQIVVGAGTVVTLFVSIGTLIAAVMGVAGGSMCRSMEASVFIALNVFTTLNCQCCYLHPCLYHLY
jgi:amino acid transporter